MTPQVPMGGTELMWLRVVPHLDLDGVNLFTSGPSEQRPPSLDVPNICWQHHDVYQPATFWMRDARQLAAVDWFVFVSEWQRQTFLQRYPLLRRERCVVIRNCVEPFPLVNRELVDKPTIIYTSTPWRGLRELLDAYEAIGGAAVAYLKVYSGTSIYGSKFDAENRASMENLYRRMAGMPGVAHVEYADNATIREELLKAHIYAYPSKWPETSCLSLIEAMCAGLDCVLFDAVPSALRETANNPDWFAQSYSQFQEMLLGAVTARTKGLAVTVSDAADTQQAWARRHYNVDNVLCEWERVLDRVRNTGKERQVREATETGVQLALPGMEQPREQAIVDAVPKSPKNAGQAVPPQPYRLPAVPLPHVRAARVFVCLPLGVATLYGTTLTALLDLQRHFIERGIEIRVLNQMGMSSVHTARNELVTKFLESGYTHLLWVDSDVGNFSGADVERMLMEDVDIICGIYPYKHIYWGRMKAALQKHPDLNDAGMMLSSRHYVLHSKSDENGGFFMKPDEKFEIRGAGSGFTLIKRHVFERFIESGEAPEYKKVYGENVDDEVETHHEFYKFRVRDGKEISEDILFNLTWIDSFGGKVWGAPWVKLSHMGPQVFAGDIIATASLTGLV